jgi:CDP-diacylglycerol--serine O-phosphatidyltransferase
MLIEDESRRFDSGRSVRKIAIIPTVLTLGNAVCGLAAIAYASKIDLQNPETEFYFAVSGWLLIGGMLFDALDGYVARLSKSASKFGGELDSLCDAVSFGAAPAILVLKMGPGWEPRPFLHQFLASIAGLYMVCTLLRLARFNVENSPDPASHKRFRGLPSPGAAGCLASLAILRGEMGDPNSTLGALMTRYGVDSQLLLSVIEVWATLGALVVALLMVSNVPYPHVTKQVLNQFVKARHFSHLIQVVLIGFIILMTRELALIVCFWFYALGLPARVLLLRSVRSEPLPNNENTLVPHE